MRLSAIVVLALVTVGCGENPLAPSEFKVNANLVKGLPTPSPAPTPEPTTPTVSEVTGPSGCLEARELPSVVKWSISRVTTADVIARSYEGDEEANCEATPNTQLRTQNDHLRYRLEGSTLYVEFDRDTFNCGRVQVDIDVNGQTRIGVVIRYTENCLPPIPSPLPVPPNPPCPSLGCYCQEHPELCLPPVLPPPPPPVPPAPPVCPTVAADSISLYPHPSPSPCPPKPESPKPCKKTGGKCK